MTVYKERITLFFIIVLVLASCTNNSKNNTDCSSVGACSNPDINSTSSQVQKIESLDSEYFDPNTEQWVGMAFNNEATNLGTLTIFSDSFKLKKEQALLSVIESTAQMNNNQTTSVNSIPYLKFTAVDGYRYLVNYKKYAGLDHLMEETSFYAQISSGVAYIPFVNDQFGGKLKDSTITDTPTSGLSHVLKISPIGPDSTTTGVKKTIRFGLNPQSKLTGIKINVSPEALNFNLSSRWKSYYKNNVDGVPNDDFDLISLSQKDEGTKSIPYDLKVAFKDTPTIKMKEVIFVEETLDLDKLRDSGLKIPQRRKSYFAREINLNSVSHFKHKIKINGNEVTMTNGKESIVRNIPSDTLWEIGITADFNKSAHFAANKNLLTPLRPVCQIFNNILFYPIAEKNAMDTFRNSGGQGYYCHPTENKKILIEPNSIGTSSLSNKPYQWFDFFFYRQESGQTTSNGISRVDVGSFYGIGKVEFTFDACVQIYTREAVSSDINPVAWQLVNSSSPECEDSNSGQGWAKITYKLSDEIFNHKEDVSDRTDIQLSIDAYTSKSKKTRPVSDWYFNGDVETDRIF